MSLPFFYFADSEPTQKEFLLQEESSRHVVQVLRMMEGEKLNLTDGKGYVFTTEITHAHKKHCKVLVKAVNYHPPAPEKTIIAISLLKNTSRFEWFLEKATEIGVSEIIPLICERTEKQKFRMERMNQICISAMLQSQQCWLPLLHEPTPLGNLAKGPFENHQRFIAHCDEGEKSRLIKTPVSQSAIILIGPEGDFTKNEIELALNHHFIPVSLGATRLRSETAGVVAAVLLTST